MHVTGGAHVQGTDELDPTPARVRAILAEMERVTAVVAECHAAELLEALKSAVAGAPHWRSEAQALLRKIASGIMPEPKR
jgi:hypothetical protein